VVASSGQPVDVPDRTALVTGASSGGGRVRPAARRGSPVPGFVESRMTGDAREQGACRISEVVLPRVGEAL
jgi:hypothetical protein